MSSHRLPVLAALVLLLALVTVFAPTLFMGRVISVNDTVLDEIPWRSVNPSLEVMNPELKETATTFVSQTALLRRHGTDVAVWNPYVTSGEPGLAAWPNGLLSPTVLPALALPEAQLLNAIVLAKLVVAFVGMLLLLRGRGLDTDSSAVGAIAFAMSGPMVAQWLWTASSTAAALPFLLWTIDRSRRIERWSRRIALAAAGWALFATGGDAGATVAGLALAATWWVFLLIREPLHRSHTLRALGAHAIALVLVCVALLPAIKLAAPSSDTHHHLASGLGLDVARLVVDPFALGDPRRLTYEAPPGWSEVRHAESCLAPGWVALALAAIGLVSRRRDIAFWASLAALIILVLAWTPLTSLASRLPGAPGPGALTPLFAVAVATLAAAGAERLQPLAPAAWRWAGLVLLAGAIILQQGAIAIHLLPYLPESSSTPQPTAGIRWLQQRTDPPTTRIVPLFSTLWPDLPQRFGLADVRGQGPDVPYRRWLQSVDSQAWGHWGDVVLLNGATVDLHHPYLQALGGRYVLEPPDLQVVAYSLGSDTVELEPRTRQVGPLRTGATVVQQLEPPPGCSRIAIHAVRTTRTIRGTVQIMLTDVDRGAALGSWTIDAHQLTTQGFAWLDLAAPPTSGHRCLLTLSFGTLTGAVTLLATPADEAPGSLLVNERPLDGDLGLSYDVSGYSQVYSGPDLRIWENRNALPRGWLVHTIVPGDLETLLSAEPPFSLADVAVLPTNVAGHVDRQLSPPTAPESVRCSADVPGWTFHISVTGGAILSTSIRARPGLWRMTIDGVETPPYRVNGLFMGALLEPGEHTVQFEPRLPRSWWIPSVGAITLLGILLATACLPTRSKASQQP